MLKLPEPISNLSHSPGGPPETATGGRQGRARAQDARVREGGAGDQGGEPQAAEEAAAGDGEEGGAVQASVRVRVEVRFGIA